MDLKHEFTVPATLDETWAAFNDIASVAQCFPGAVVTEVDGDTFKGTVKVKLGPIALVYNGTGTFVEKDESAHRMLIDAKGKDKRGNGTAGANVTATMTDEGGGNTRVQVVTDLNITGKPAQFGRGVIQDVSDKLLGQFTSCLEKKVGAPADEPVQDAAAPAVPQLGDDEASVAAAPAPPGGDAPVGTAPSSASRPVTTIGTASRPAAGAGSPTSSSDGGEDALDLGATVIPILVKGYWREGLIGVLGVLLLVKSLRRR